MNIFSQFRDCLFRTKPSLQMIIERTGGNFEAHQPHNSGMGFAIHGKKSCTGRGTAITSLLFRCSPFTVFRTVIAVIIATLYRMVARRSRAHVTIENDKIFPAFANTYVSATIICKPLLVIILATLLYSLPNFIFRRARLAVFTRFIIQTFTYFKREAPTRFRRAIAQSAGRHFLLCPAIAARVKKRFPIFRNVGEHLKHEPSSETSTCYVDSFRHIV